MFIRQSSTRPRPHGEPYFTYRLVESVREGSRVRQHTLLNLGRHFEVPREQWGALVQRIEQITSGQHELLATGLAAEWYGLAEQIAAQLLLARGPQPPATSSDAPDLQSVDLDSLELLRPRSVGIEHLALSAIEQLGLEAQLEALGLNGNQRAALIGNLVARIAAPRSERGTYHWLCETSAVGELLGFDYHRLPLMSLYRATDALFRHQETLERFLYARERSLFDCEEVITLYDLTNTYFEGQAIGNALAARGHSKEKRSDCPLVTLALVLDGSGFPRRSEVFPGNVGEPGTLGRMLEALRGDEAPTRSQTVVLDAGIASEANIDYLKAQGYRYLVVSRRRRMALDPSRALPIDPGDGQAARIHVQRVVDEDSGELSMYCHSRDREDKDRAIARRAAARFEAELTRLHEGLTKPRTTKRHDKVWLRIGRLKQRHSRAARYYEIDVDHDEASGCATAVRWQRTTSIDATHPGVYCLRTNQDAWDDATLWRTYTLLTDLEAVFRSLKSELGLRPVYHHKAERVASHLFLSVLAYHVVHTLRFQLKQHEIDLSWEGVRRVMGTQQRVTTQLRRADGRTLHVRKATRAEDEQKRIYDALGISASPGRVEKTLV